MPRKLLILLALAPSFWLLAPTTYAQIVNPALDNFGSGGTGSAGNFAAILVTNIWRLALILGGLGTIIFLIWGGAAYLTSGGDKTKVDAARDRIASALAGMAILFILIALVNFIGPFFGFDFLKLEFPDNITTPPNTQPPTSGPITQPPTSGTDTPPNTQPPTSGPITQPPTSGTDTHP